jgi:hypothetical protein
MVYSPASVALRFFKVKVAPAPTGRETVHLGLDRGQRGDSLGRGSLGRDVA